jgi:anti-anti-sigma factor
MNLLVIDRADLGKGVWALGIRGSLDASNVNSFVEAAAALIGQGARHVLIELREAQYVSSTGFGSFLKVVDDAAERQGRVVFVGVPPSIKGIFKLLGLESALSFAPDRETALTFLNAGVAIADGSSASPAEADN